jgi:uncharacterized CHY-type Zn-finger protein
MTSTNWKLRVKTWQQDREYPNDTLPCMSWLQTSSWAVMHISGPANNYLQKHLDSGPACGEPYERHPSLYKNLTHFHLSSKHILNAQVAIRAPCCKRWFDCAECHAETQTHDLRKSLEMNFLCKKCKKAFRKDTSEFDESDEYCPHCDNHFVSFLLCEFRKS